MKRKLASFILCLAMAGGVLCGCAAPSSSGTPSADGGAGSEASAGAEGGEPSDYPSYITQPGELPIVNDPIAFTAFMPVPDVALSLTPETNKFSKWLLDQTNINFEFNLVSSADAMEKLRLMITGGEYPDILFRSNFSLSEQLVYGQQGILLPLNDLIDKYCVNVQPMFEAYPEAKTMFTVNDGNMYDLPSVNDCFHCALTQKMWVYKPWLDKLGASVPTTTEEFYELLKLIKETDLNENGKQDEVPLACSPKGWDSNLDGFLMQPFAPANAYGLYVEDGIVKTSYTEEGWREGLRYLKKLYDEGLVAPESLVQDGEQLVQMGSTPEHILAFAPGGYQGSFAKNPDEWGDWVTIAPLIGPSGRQETAYAPEGNFYSSFSITNKCEYPEAAIRLADFLLTKDATLNSYWGLKGERWEDIEGEELPSIDGGIATWRPLIADADISPNEAWGQAIPTYRPSSLRLGTPLSDGFDLEASLYQESKNNYAPYIPDEDSIFNKSMLAFDEAAATELAMYEQPITDLRNEFTAKFITGEMDIENDWDTYLAELEKAGVPRMLAIYQAAFDAKNSQ